MAKRVMWIVAADKGWHLPALFLCLLVAGAGVARAQYVSPYVAVHGTLTTSSGLAAQNATLTFSPSQVMFVSGTSLIVQESQCGTDTNGSVVGIGNPVTGPRVSAQNTGTLTHGNYYVRFTWYDQFGIQTLASPEVAVQLTHTGEIQVLPPVGTGPPQAKGLDIYIGTTPGGETYQGQTTSLTAQYTQATDLSTTGNASPIRNLTVCRVVANDAGFPTGTGYNVSLLDASGNTLFAYPEMWQFFGPGSTYNLSSGIPYYHGEVTYPIPILTIPFNHNPQSISGALSLSGYNLYSVGAIGVGTATPAWGIDVEAGPGSSGVNSVHFSIISGSSQTGWGGTYPLVFTGGGGGSGAAGYVTIECVGHTAYCLPVSTTITSPGSGYDSPPTVTVPSIVTYGGTYTFTAVIGGDSGRINAASGYLVNGSAGTAGTCLSSDGVSYEIPFDCLSASDVPQAPWAHAIVVSDMTATVYSASQTVAKMLMPVAGTIPAGGTGTYNGVLCTTEFNLSAITTASTTFTLADNGTPFGTIMFTASTLAAPTITITPAKAVAIGDVISILAPSTTDATAAGLFGSLCFAF